MQDFYQTIFEKGVLPLIGTFCGAALAFFSQAYRDKNNDNKNQRDLIISTYRTNVANLTALLTFKNQFLAEYDGDFRQLLEFCREYSNPIRPERREEMRKKWIHEYRTLFLKIAQGKERGPGLLKQRWERPVFLSLQEEKLHFVARYNPSIPALYSFMKSTHDLIQTELAHREKMANDLSRFFEDQEPVKNGDLTFIRELTLLMTTVEGIQIGIDRAIALTVGLLPLLENHYFTRYGTTDFLLVKFSKENFNLFPVIAEYNNFFGSEGNFYIIEQRLKYAKNTIEGHRELNLKNSVLPSKVCC